MSENQETPGHQSPGEQQRSEYEKKFGPVGGDRRASNQFGVTGGQGSTTNISEQGSPYAPRVTQKQIMSHHFGFGNIQVDRVGHTQIKNKATGLEASGKFQEKLMLKQRALEEMMMENRLKKLMCEEDRLRKQCNLAMRNTDFAEQVSNRRMDDFNSRANWLNNKEGNRQAALSLNTQRRENNRDNINNGKHRVLSTNIYSRQSAGTNTSSHNSTITSFRRVDLNHKQTNAANMYQTRKEASFKAKYDKDAYLESIQRVNQHQKFEHCVKKEAHENTLNKLQEIEERLIGDLQRTLQKKNAAVDTLQQRSPALKKQMQPRLAYKYKKRDGSSGYMTQTGGFGHSSDQLLMGPVGRDNNNKSEAKMADDHDNTRNEVVVLNPNQPRI